MKRMEMDGWIEVFQTGTDYEAELVRDRLDDAGIEAVIMTKKDRAFSLTHGAMSRIHVMVPAEREGDALDLLHSEPLSDEELTRAALARDPEDAPPPEGEDEGEESLS
ncbi:MAG: DUF2007 domain-containing protein [Bacteroidetes bacterium]|nr:DUF2007 domain-containing protein [Bacteroidota bacterium]